MAILKFPVTEQDHIQGDKNAVITLVEYGDYQCPYCGEAYPVVKKLQAHFGKNLRFVFRNFPIVDSHPNARIAAMAAEFAASKNKFWEMHDLLYENQESLELPNLIKYAESIGLSGKELELAFENHSFVEKIENDFSGGVRSGVNGTPAFYVNGTRYDDSFDYKTFVAHLEKLLTPS